MEDNKNVVAQNNEQLSANTISGILDITVMQQIQIALK